MTQLAQADRRYTHPDYCVWSAHVNGVVVEYGTSDPRLVVYVHRVNTETMLGAELVDGHGHRLASEVHWRP